MGVLFFLKICYDWKEVIPLKRILLLLLLPLILYGCTPDPIPTATSTQIITQPSFTSATTVSTVQTTFSTTQAETTAPVDPLMSLLNSLTTEEKVGQLFLARCPDINAVADIQQYHLGGYILFARDFENETPASVQSTLQGYQDTSAIPLLIAVDEEGGIVNRVSKFPAFRETPFSSSQYLYAQGGFNKIRENEVEKCTLLGSLGINVNVGPVCDVTTDPSAFMYRRSLGQDAQTTAQFVRDVVGVMQDHKIGGILKHFPGYGNNTDTHTGIAIDDRPLNHLESVDLVPFAAGIEAGCDAIMISHTFVKALDADVPASLSHKVHDYLRKTMGFEGLSVTDDLVMQAITDIYGIGESAVLAVQCGNDLLCVTDYKQQYAAVLEAVNDGRITQEALNTAVLRILRWKADLGLIG